MTLTNNDLKNIGIIFEQKFDELGVVTKDDIKHLPTKEEYYKREDKTMGKLEKIEVLEKIHPDNSHIHLQA